MRRLARYGGHTSHRCCCHLPAVSAAVGQAAPSTCRRGSILLQSGGLMSTTRINRFLPPAVSRALMAVALAGVELFAQAYAKESRKIREQQAETRQECGEKMAMSVAEAVKILGVEEHVDPSIFSGPAPTDMDFPILRDPEPRAAAKKNFDQLLSVAQQNDNYFLAGKVSLAYRICVDPQWDATEDEASKDRVEGK